MTEVALTGDHYDDWLKEGRDLAELDRSLTWEIGDWWARGEHAYGERTKAAALLFAGGYSYKSLCNLGSIARNVESSRRREGLSWSHHAEVAPMDAARQDKYLGQAEEHGWSVRELRRAIRADGEEKIDGPCAQGALPSAGDDQKREWYEQAPTVDERTAALAAAVTYVRPETVDAEIIEGVIVEDESAAVGLFDRLMADVLTMTFSPLSEEDKIKHHAQPSELRKLAEKRDGKRIASSAPAPGRSRGRLTRERALSLSAKVPRR